MTDAFDYALSVGVPSVHSVMAFYNHLGVDPSEGPKLTGLFDIARQQGAHVARSLYNHFGPGADYYAIERAGIAQGVLENPDQGSYSRALAKTQAAAAPGPGLGLAAIAAAILLLRRK